MKAFLQLMASLIVNKASRKDWYLQIGCFLMKKGLHHQIGDIVHVVPIGIKNKHKITEIKNIYFDLSKNKMKYQYEHSITELNEKGR